MKRRIISFDSSYALAAVKIFMSCYKRGIKDAEYISDKYMCDDFKKRVRVPGVYGRVTDDYTVSESDWIVYLLFANGTRPAPPPQANLINGINKRSKMACLYRVAQEFYILGLDDYNECPSIHEFSLLDKTNMIRWTPKGLVKITKSEVVSEVQRMCILRSRIDSESEDYDSCLFKIDYEKFAMDLWLNLIGYKTQLFE